MNFETFRKAVQKRWADMCKTHGKSMFRVYVEDGNELNNLYLRSFPAGSDPIFKQRSTHDCAACRHFIRDMGNVVAISETLGLQTIWDVDLPGEPEYQHVADELSNWVRSKGIVDGFFATNRTAGVDKDFGHDEEGNVEEYTHFFVNIPNDKRGLNYVVGKDEIGTLAGRFRDKRNVAHRALEEFTVEAIDTVIELVDQNSLYRGSDNIRVVKAFRQYLVSYQMTRPELKERFSWRMAALEDGSVCMIRNTSIGTLLSDLSTGAKDLENAVKAYEAKVAPANYQRPKSLVTKAMVERAQKQVEELGLTSALRRRYANLDDLTADNVLYLNRDAAPSPVEEENPFDLVPTKGAKKGTFSKVEEISIIDFVNKILPSVRNMEVMVENRHSPRLFSLTTAEDATARPLFKWDNPFAWSYNGDMTDSNIKEKVKKAGGNVQGVFRCSLSWSNYDDLDIHLLEPGAQVLRQAFRNISAPPRETPIGAGRGRNMGTHIFFGNRMNRFTGGQLDVDMNAGGHRSRSAVENIYYEQEDNMLEGIYRLYVNNFALRETKDIGFEVEMDYKGAIQTFSHPKGVSNGDSVLVAEFRYTKKNGIELLGGLPGSTVSRDIWHVKTQQFVPVTAMFMSPNCWGAGDEAIGARHYFFALRGCWNDESGRGYYNEFLRGDLQAHRKVLELLGSKSRTGTGSEGQVSGVGFNETQRDNILVKVSGAFTRVLKVVF